MAFTRDISRIPTGAATVKMGATGGAVSDVGYMVEDSLKIVAKEITATDEYGMKIPTGVEVTIEFELLQGDYTMFQDLDALRSGNVDIEIHPKSGSPPYYKVTDIAFYYEVEQVWSNSKARTVVVMATRKAAKVTDVISKELG